MKLLLKFSKIILLVLALGVGYAIYANPGYVTHTLDLLLPDGESQAVQGVLRQDLNENDFKTIATGLEVPWDIAFLPDGALLVTERPGRIKRVANNGTITAVSGIEDTRDVGEGGLLGIVLHPEFAKNGWIYLYQTISTKDGAKNQVNRYRLADVVLTERTTIIKNIPGATYHDGGELAFGPDGKLYITTGDASQAVLAQDLKSLAGKILRLNDDGTIPSDNPFSTAIWSYGHRNPQGLAWDARGQLWSVEHGRSGALSGFDELNRIEAGANYGWPNIEGDEESEGMTKPVVHSGANDTWAPGGVAFYSDSMIFGGLRGAALYQAKLSETPVKIIAHFENEYGRIRAVSVGPDKMLYFTTSNRDGRGVPKSGDDKIIRLNPRLFQ